ncbi:hypothetical protein ACFOMH_18640 [Paracoccus mangrovi]|uniref:Uncharacterized protein n=1 Tax=Paracoccus mangrovi TaxID=1715645 RepID=A0ABV7RCZ3_9RHOB
MVAWIWMPQISFVNLNWRPQQHSRGAPPVSGYCYSRRLNWNFLAILKLAESIKAGRSGILSCRMPSLSSCMPALVVSDLIEAELLDNQPVDSVTYPALLPISVQKNGFKTQKTDLVT